MFKLSKEVLVLHRSLIIAFLFFWPLCLVADPRVVVGIDVLLEGKHDALLKGKRLGVITNHTAVNRDLLLTSELLKRKAREKGFKLVAFFAPEHGIKGGGHASDEIQDERDADGIPVYSLHGKTRRPTDEMLKGIDLLVYDIQDIGSRSYTYISTLFYVMEEAAKRGISVLVADRPNPLNGVVVDGPLMEEKWRSFVGYVNVPYCHGMTVGELARFFNEEYKVKCALHVIPMRGWKRSMTFADTGLPWIPTSPNIPEATSPLYYPATGILGELQLVSIGVGYTLPFKVLGAPWIDGPELAKQLNAQKLPGIRFIPFYFRPFSGKFVNEDCQGVLLNISNASTYKPIQTQYTLIGILKSLYPEPFANAIAASQDRQEMFNKVNGTDRVYKMIVSDKFIAWKLRELDADKRAAFKPVRAKYLLAEYGNGSGK